MGNRSLLSEGSADAGGEESGLWIEVGQSW